MDDELRRIVIFAILAAIPFVLVVYVLDFPLKAFIPIAILGTLAGLEAHRSANER